MTMIAVFAASAPAFAVDGTVQKTHATTKADAKVKPAKRPVTKGVLDLMPTQSIVKTGKILGSTATSGAVAKAMTQRGYRFLIAGSDAVLLGQAAAAAVKDFRS